MTLTVEQYQVRKERADSHRRFSKRIGREDNALDYSMFLQMLESEGYEIKQGKYLAVKPPGMERFRRTKTLGQGYGIDELKERILRKNRLKIGHYKFSLRYIVATCIILVLLMGTTVGAEYLINDITRVNKKVIPELDPMKKFDMVFPDGMRQDSIIFFYDFTDINAFCEETQLHLLTTDLTQNNNYMLGSLQTDKSDDAIITVDNFIIGDTSDFKYSEEDGFYTCTRGKNYITPVTMKAVVILSDEQLAHGWDHEYLGDYKYIESFVSSQGYKVNIIKSTSTTCAEFVADGIRYTFSGNVSIETMKEIVNSLKAE